MNSAVGEHSLAIAIVVPVYNEQDAIESLHASLRRRGGYDIVPTQRIDRDQPSVFQRLTSAGFYWLLSIGLYLCVLQALREDSTAVEATFRVVALPRARTVPPRPGFMGIDQLVRQQALVLPFGGKDSRSTALAATLTAYLVYCLTKSFLGAIGFWRAGEPFGGLGRPLLA